MNKEDAKNCIIGSIVAINFLGFGFGITFASHLPILCQPFTGLLIAGIGLATVLILLQIVEMAGYKVKLVTKEDKKDE